MATLTLEYSNAVENTHFEAAQQIVYDHVIDRLIGAKPVNNTIIFEVESKKKLDGLNDDILKLCNLLDYNENNFIVYEDANFGHRRYKKFDKSTNQIITRFNNTTLSIVMLKNGSVKFF